MDRFHQTPDLTRVASSARCSVREGGDSDLANPDLMPPTPSQPTVAIAGGGLAGLATACALSDVGFRVTLFEKRPFLGGRASSYEHPGTGEVVDNCQHVVVPHLHQPDRVLPPYRRRRSDPLVRSNEFHRTRRPDLGDEILPSSRPPSHRAIVLNFSFLSVADKLSIARALVPLTLTQQRDLANRFNIGWIATAKPSTRRPASGDRFWSARSAKNSTRISISAAAQVVRESMKSPAARQMGVPTVPLTDLYNAAGRYVQARGGVLHFRRPVERFVSESSQVRVRLSDAEEPFDFLVVALPFDALDRVLPGAAESTPLREQLSHFENSPITGVHMWFDRQISDLDHAVLLDRTVQWMFPQVKTAADSHPGDEWNGHRSRRRQLHRTGRRVRRKP